MRKFNRIILLILDSVGCGAQEDARRYQSEKANTLGSVIAATSNLHLVNLKNLGLQSLISNEPVKGNVGKMRQLSAGNDTFAGTWEMLGVPFSKRFRTTREPFSKEVLSKFVKETGYQLVGNEYISGFQALDKYFVQHRRLRSPILYLADDGVVLLAAHEEIIPSEELNRLGKILVDILAFENIARVITRPFIGSPGSFIRTENRKDFLGIVGLYPKSAFHGLQNAGVTIWTTEHLHRIMGQPEGYDVVKGNHSNEELRELLVKQLERKADAEVLFACFQDFDMFGHKKDPIGYGKCLEEFDCGLPKILNAMGRDDLLMIVADHGCDPTLEVRGHTREFVPLIVYSPSLQGSCSLGTREGFGDVGQTILFNFGLPLLSNGKPIYEIF